MRTMTPQDIAKDWKKLATEAAREPIRVHEEGAPDVVILSEADYEKFRELIGDRLKEVMDRMGAKAKARGLTEDELATLLADES